MDLQVAYRAQDLGLSARTKVKESMALSGDQFLSTPWKEIAQGFLAWGLFRGSSGAS